METINTKQIEKAVGRITGVPLVKQVHRSVRCGGFASLQRKPYAWSVSIPIEGKEHVLTSSRNHRREWTDLNRLTEVLVSLGFDRWLFDTRNT